MLCCAVLCWVQQALQAQSHSQQQAMADMVKQHQEVCGRLAAAATAEADLQQQLARLAGDKQMLQQQIDKVGDLECKRVQRLGGVGYTGEGLGGCGACRVRCLAHTWGLSHAVHPPCGKSVALETKAAQGLLTLGTFTAPLGTPEAFV